MDVQLYTCTQVNVAQKTHALQTEKHSKIGTKTIEIVRRTGEMNYILLHMENKTWIQSQTKIHIYSYLWEPIFLYRYLLKCIYWQFRNEVSTSKKSARENTVANGSNGRNNGDRSSSSEWKISGETNNKKKRPSIYWMTCMNSQRESK